MVPGSVRNWIALDAQFNNPIIQKKKTKNMTTSQLRNSICGSVQRCGFLLIWLACFALPQRTKAVVPAPDGGYPNFTTAEGTKALFSLTTGSANTAVGWSSLLSNTAGSFNTGVGAGTLVLNTGDSNTAVGAIALLLNTTGSDNTAVGVNALKNNTGGFGNTATGSGALSSNASGTGNTANGYGALQSNTDGGENAAVGVYTLPNNTTGHANTAVGNGALNSNTTGSFNTALGVAAGSSLTSGSYNIDIDVMGVEGESNTIRIGNSYAGVGHTATYIAGIAGKTVGFGGTACYVDYDGKLGVLLSARRFKTDIADMGDVSQALLALRPVTFHYKPELDKTGIPQFGLIAEEVAKANPDLVTHDAKGELSTVRYEAVNAMLLNEFLKEHRTVQELKFKAAKQEATIAQQQKQIEALTAGLQKVSAQLAAASPSRGGLEASKPMPQVVDNR